MASPLRCVVQGPGHPNPVPGPGLRNRHPGFGQGPPSPTRPAPRPSALEREDEPAGEPQSHRERCEQRVPPVPRGLYLVGPRVAAGAAMKEIAGGNGHGRPGGFIE